MKGGESKEGSFDEQGKKVCNENYKKNEVIYRSVLSKWEFFIKMRAAFLALSFLHNSREDGGKKGSSHFDEKLSFW